MRVISTDHLLSNAEVLQWTKSKRTQHKEEEAEDRAEGVVTRPRPKNFMKILEKTENHLKTEHYPYLKNPSAYDGPANQSASLVRFGEALEKNVDDPLVEEFKIKIRKGLMRKQAATDALEEKQEKMELSEAELLMIVNHAPTNVEMLQPIVEEVDDRFTRKELEAMVECIKEVFRPDQVESGEVVLGVEEKKGKGKEKVVEEVGR